MTTPLDFVQVARALVGTRFHAGGRCPGVGLDCIGVAVCAAIACGIRHKDMRAYPLRPNGQLLKELDGQMVSVYNSAGVWNAELADILAMQFDDEPHHIAVYAGETIIHAYAAARKCVEQPMSKYWRERVKRVYRFKEFASVG